MSGAVEHAVCTYFAGSNDKDHAGDVCKVAQEGAIPVSLSRRSLGSSWEDVTMPQHLGQQAGRSLRVQAPCAAEGSRSQGTTKGDTLSTT